jgi:hypothetical protein
VATAQVIGWPLQHQGPIERVVYRGDGLLVLTASEDGTARVWEAGTGKPVGPPLVHGERVGAAAFSPDGGTILSGSNDKTARLRPMPAALEDDVERLVVWAKLVTGLEMDAGGTIQELDAAAWRRCKQRLAERP